MPTTKPRPFTIAICGAGITGLTLAAVLSTAKPVNTRIDIYEAKAEISADGLNIAVWKRVWQVLESLGFGKDCEQRGIRTPREGQSSGPIFRRADIPEPVDFHSQSMPYGPMVIGRPQLLEILQTKLNPDICTVHRNMKLTSYSLETENDPGTSVVRLHFNDSTTAVADILLGCDGVQSAVRRTLFANNPQYALPQFSGQLAYRSMTKQEDTGLEEGHPALQMRSWSGLGKHVITNGFTHPLTQTKVLMLVCYDTVPVSSDLPEWSAKVPVTEIQAKFPASTWDPDLVRILAASDDPTRWAVHVVRDLPSFSDGERVAVLGDAAHAMTPHQGIGAGQGIEDALVLGRLLAHPLRSPFPSSTTLRALMEVYDEMRVEPAQRAVRKSQRTGELADLLPLKDASFEGGPGEWTLEKIGQAIGDEFAWLGVGAVEEDWARAEGLLKEKLRTTAVRDHNT